MPGKSEAYKTIAERAQASFIEKKSEFIGNIAPCSTEAEALSFIEEIRKQHRKATHNCYAYILRENNIGRHSDDGEPSGTAGAPMFEVLKKEGLTNVCCVVTRYFGGILLGVGGLVRAYSAGVSAAIDASRVKVMKTAVRMSVDVEYSLYGKLGAVFSEFDARVESEEFGAGVSIVLYVESGKAEGFKGKVVDICFGRVEVKELGEEEFDFGG